MSSSSISLTNAVTSGDERAVSLLLSRGADVNQSTSGGQTALILAIIFGHTNLVRLLVRAGADPQLRDNLGLNAIEWAKRRGSREALEILTNGPESPLGAQKVVKVEEPPRSRPVVEPPPAPPKVAIKETVSEDEKSRRWLAGVKQRLDEQELRRADRNGSSLIPAPPPPAPPTPPEPVTTTPPIVAPLVESSTSVLTPIRNRRRCPQCNALYSDMVSYCAHHYVPLVDADEPIVSEPPKPNPPLFWVMVVITLTGSIVVGSLITAYMYRTNQAAARSSETQPIIQKGTPELGGDLVGKAVSLPEAECPLNGPDPVTGTVIVNVKVDKKGEVYWARGSGGDWLMRGASTEAAMKSTFSTEKLRGREVEGTITYTFKPN